MFGNLALLIPIFSSYRGNHVRLAGAAYIEVGETLCYHNLS
jgi:hypothetical protein